MRREILLIALIGIFTASIQGQTAGFTFQGRLSDNSAAANGTYQMQFSLYDALSGGTQLGTTITNNTVTVTNGVFTVQLDFSPATPFATGADRWIEMAVRKAADPPGFTLLSPRQQVTSAPYATRAASTANADSAANAAQLGGVAANQYVVTTDPRMTDARTPTAGSSNYIQNQNAGAQASSNFNISGTGTANIFSATTQYNIGASRILSNAGTENLFAGVGAGQANTTGFTNSLFGVESGFQNTTGFQNSFFGTSSGRSNTTGVNNSFFGVATGLSNTTGSNNTALGYNANVGSGNLTFATAIGSGSTVSTSNTIALGRNTGQDTVVIPGTLSVTGAINGTVANANQLGGITAGGFIQNSSSQQAASNFNISGTGTADTFNAATQYNIGTIRVLSAPGSENLFAGFQAGANNAGASNAFFGAGAGAAISTGYGNSFFGTEAGFSNTGSENAFFGSFAGYSPTTGDGNTIIGASAGTGVGNLTNATAIGRRALVGASNSLVLGSINGVNSATADTNVGIGTTTPQYRLHVRGQDIRVEGNTSSISPRFSLNFTGGATDEKRWQNYATTNQLVFSALNDAESAENRWLIVNRGTGTAISSVDFFNNVAINVLGSAGATPLCRNASNQISTCSSSARYKSSVADFRSGLELVKKLRPVSFRWKDGGMKDVGFGAEDVAAIEPLLATTNAKGEIEGVKYDRLSVVFVNAFKEQQAQIEASQKEIAEQKSTNQKLQSQIDELKKIVCSLKPDADGCKQEEK